MVLLDTRCQEPGAWVEPKGLLVALHYREVESIIINESIISFKIITIIIIIIIVLKINTSI